MSAQRPAGHPLLVVIDPAARAMDGESVRIAKDVLCAGSSSVKIALPDSAEEVERALAHRGRRRTVIIGDDDALLRVVRALHRERTLGQAPVGLVPVGHRSALPLARALGVPAGAVPAARAVLDGAERELDLLVDDSGGIVVGALRIPCGAAPPVRLGWPPIEQAARTARAARSLVRSLVANGHPQRLRVEADGVILADLDRPVHEVSVRTAQQPGLAEVLVRGSNGSGPVFVQARTVTVSGRDFRYRADAAVSGPVRTRTWTLQPAAWRLTVPR
ncbi:diacylglycerol kinase [Streptomyces sp. NBC_01262]|uniref:diacylglycerol kinase n=1 Tax=Streptomyces sp. NBC_01262 TaxID=2903803 RepID=UPI003FCEB4E4